MSLPLCTAVVGSPVPGTAAGMDSLDHTSLGSITVDMEQGKLINTDI